MCLPNFYSCDAQWIAQQQGGKRAKHSDCRLHRPSPALVVLRLSFSVTLAIQLAHALKLTIKHASPPDVLVARSRPNSSSSAYCLPTMGNSLHKACSEKDLQKVRVLVLQHPGQINQQEKEVSSARKRLRCVYCWWGESGWRGQGAGLRGLSGPPRQPASDSCYPAWGTRGCSRPSCGAAMQGRSPTIHICPARTSLYLVAYRWTAWNGHSLAHPLSAAPRSHPQPTPTSASARGD